MTGQVLIAFGLVFGILGVGCFWKPELFGPITSKLLENFARAEERNSRTYEQNQQESKNSPQIITKGDVTITNTSIYGHDLEKRKKRN